MMIYKIIQLRFVNGIEDVALVAAKFDNAPKSGCGPCSTKLDVCQAWFKISKMALIPYK